MLAEFERRHFFRGESEPPELVRMAEERNGAVYGATWGSNEWTLTGALAGGTSARGLQSSGCRR